MATRISLAAYSTTCVFFIPAARLVVAGEPARAKTGSRFLDMRVMTERPRSPQRQARAYGDAPFDLAAIVADRSVTVAAPLPPLFTPLKATTMHGIVSC